MIAPVRKAVTRFFWGTRNPYDSVKHAGTRQAPHREIASEDWMVRDLDRDFMSTRVRNLTRNFSLAAWAVRKHVDYLTRFRFKSLTGNESFDRDVEAFMLNWSKRFNCDANQKHSLLGLIRLMEQCRTVDGDVFLLKVGGSGSRRGSVQLIEAQRVRDPAGAQNANAALPGARGSETVDYSRQRWVDGVRLNDRGIAIQYAVHKRGPEGDGFILERIVPARQIIQHGVYHRVDQIRGISPLNAAANSFRDLYETEVYAVAGVKAAQLTGLVIKQNYQGNTLGAEHIDPMGDRKSQQKRQKINWGPRPEVINLGPDEEASFIDSKKPGAEAMALLDAMSHMAIKALDIPRSFWDESISNYSVNRAAATEYGISMEPKIFETQCTLDELTAWRLGMALADGELVFPRGMDWDDMRWRWGWRGRPYIDPDKEAKAEELKILLGLSNPIDAAAKIDQDFHENMLKTRQAIDLAAEQGLAPSFAAAMALGTTAAAADDEPDDDDEVIDDGDDADDTDDEN